jgi:hypothetical protein
VYVTKLSTQENEMAGRRENIKRLTVKIEVVTKTEEKNAQRKLFFYY